MAFNTNIGTAWISVVPETKRIAGELDKALTKAEKGISGESLGKKIASGIGKTLTAGVATAGVAAGGILAVSLTKGLGRLTGIENAQAKLSGLGHEAEGVAAIMDDALASVKGTAFGLEDAATVAASAVAAGVKPGDELQRTLKLTGDAATIAGVGMSDMGAIFNKVAASNKMQMDVANQLMDAGIPIMQMVAEQMGVTTEEATKMASEGKISFEIFQTALEEGLGGAALKSGETVQGAFANMGAAAGRFGAKLADPAFQAAPAIFSAIGTVFDEVNDAITPATEKIGEILTPALESLATIIETRVAPWMGEMAGKVGDLAAIGLEKVLDPDSWSHVADIFGKVRDVVVELWPSIESLAGSFLSISQNISVATWEALTSVLEAVAPLIESVLVPLVEKIAEFAEQNPGAVEAMVWAFLGFKAVGAVAGPVATFAGALGNLGGAFSTVSTLVGAGGVVEGIKEVGKYSKDSNPILAKMGKTVGGTGKVAGTAGKIFGKLGKVFMTVIRFVNPWVAGITIVVGALTWFFTQTETGQAIVEKVTEAIVKAWGWVKEKFGEAIDWITDKFEAFTGWISDAWNGIVDLFKGDYTSAFRDAFGIEEDNPLILTFFKVRDFLIEIPKLVKGVTDILFKGEFSGLPFGLSEDSGFVKFLFGLRDVVVDTGKIITDVFQWIFDAVQITLGIIGTIVLTPLILAWNLLSWAIKGAWENIIKPAWDAMSGAAVALWEGYISPALQAISAGWDWLSGRMSAIWEAIKTVVFLAWQSYVDTLRGHWETFTSIISAAWQKVSDFFTSVWNTIKTNVFDAWSWYVTTLQSNWNIFTGALNAAWTWLKDMLVGVWNVIKSAVFDAFMAIMDVLRPHFETATTLMSNAWNLLRDGMGTAWNWIRDNVFSKFESTVNTVKSAFEIAVEGISKAWTSLKAKLAEPVNFIIKTIYTDGIRVAWGAVAGLVGLDELPKVEPIGGYAHGGILPGYTPGRDPYTFVEPTTGMAIGLSGGEAIMRPEATRALGSDWVDGVNAAARMGGTGGVKKYLGAFAGGGVISSISNIVRDKFPGMSITSTLRPGDPGHHGTGNAVDFSDGTDSTPGMRAAAAYFAQNYGSTLLELIHSPFNQNIKNGQSVGDGFGFYGAGTMNAHRNHVHVASGSPLPGGGTGGVMGVLEGAVGWVGDQVKKIWDGIINSIPKFSGGGGLSAELPGAFLTKAGGAAWDWIKSKVDSIGAFSGSVGAGVEQWRPMVESVLKSKGFSTDLADTVLRRMNQESGGNRQAINMWDSNAAAGVPSKGLMQVIDPTFAAHKDPGFDDIWDPEANLRASMNYAMSRYGSLPAAYNRAGGYADGGIVDFGIFDTGGVLKPGGVAMNMSGKPERILPPQLTQSFDKFMLSMPEVARYLESASHSLNAAAVKLEPVARTSAEDYVRGQTDSALGMVGLGGARELVEGIQSRVQSIANSDEVQEGLRTVKLDPNLDYRGAEIMRKLEELGIKVEQIEDDLGGSVLGGIHTMA